MPGKKKKNNCLNLNSHLEHMLASLCCSYVYPDQCALRNISEVFMPEKALVGTAF